MKIHWDEELHLSEFVDLNNAWIEKHFHIEEFDRELARHPARVLRQGGHVLSLTEGGQVIGVCALFRESDDTYELARMAVSEEERGKGVGKRLMQEVLAFSTNNGIKKLVLISNTKLEAAIRLYTSFGFTAVSEGQHPVYQRGNIVMEKTLDVDE